MRADLPLARVAVRPGVRHPVAWCWELPVVAQLRAEGVDLAPVTVLVGENGSGKSTLVEFTEREWADLDLVQDWQAFFDDPARLLHHLLDD
ncbi:hypothetical protein [Blastococcus deserti]|uniref:Uncharacterized protein n=1 Tax=Blastococcus deserti TaxID=2259033 RepID=A0ABW4X604_9ACTN